MIQPECIARVAVYSGNMNPGTKPTGIERLLTVIAVMTTVYYLLTFAVEVGFFWTVGLQFMPAFSISDHVSHAAAWVIGSLGTVLFSIAALIMLAGALAVPSVLVGVIAGWPPVEDAKEKPALPIGKLRRISSLLLVMGGLFLIVALLLTNTDARPWSAFALSFVVAACVGFAEFVAGRKAMIWVIPASIAALLSPFALGDWLFLSAYRTPIIQDEYFVVSGRKIIGRPIFAGADKSLYKTATGLYLFTNNGDTVVHIIPDVPPHWQLPSRTPCKPRPRNDPGPRSVFCDPEPPPHP